MTKIADDLPKTGAREDVRDECERLFASHQFARSPVMRKLLAFLIEKTLAGEAERLKAYAIAVDALGKPSSFDAQMDSYPRVQVGRLRALLENNYAEREETPTIRITIPKGAYVVHFYAAPEVRDAIAVDITESDTAELAAPDLAMVATRQALRFWRIAASIFAMIALGFGVLFVAGPAIA